MDAEMLEGNVKLTSEVSGGICAVFGTDIDNDTCAVNMPLGLPVGVCVLSVMAREAVPLLPGKGRTPAKSSCAGSAVIRETRADSDLGSSRSGTTDQAVGTASTTVLADKSVEIVEAIGLD